MNTALMFSSAKDDWQTPRDKFAEWDAEFHFGIDVAASHENRLCDVWYTKDGLFNECSKISDLNGLTGGWGEGSGWAWCNPSYGRGLAKWVEKAHCEMSVYKNPSVLLIPARTDTRYFHRWIWDCEKQAPRPGVEVRFPPGRLRFEVNGVAGDAAPFPSMLVIFRGDAA